MQSAKSHVSPNTTFPTLQLLTPVSFPPDPRTEVNSKIALVEIGSSFWNPVLAAVHDLLRGKFDVRVTLLLGVGGL
jgi:hypothetical protein